MTWDTPFGGEPGLTDSLINLYQAAEKRVLISSLVSIPTAARCAIDHALAYGICDSARLIVRWEDKAEILGCRRNENQPPTFEALWKPSRLSDK
jgi:hypothetical protein